jgi:hypothetical protein
MRLGISSNSVGNNQKLDWQLEAAWKADGGTATVDAIQTLSSGGLTIGKADNIGNRKSAALGSGYVQYTVAQFKEVERDELRFAGGSTKNLLMLPSMQEKDVATISIADCLPNLEAGRSGCQEAPAAVSFFRNAHDFRRNSTPCRSDPIHYRRNALPSLHVSYSCCRPVRSHGP